MAEDIHEVYAIRYGHHSRHASANFIDNDPHNILQPLDFFVWAIVGPSGAIIVDAGFDEAMGKKRQREMIKPVREGLTALGIAPETVNTVILSHLHLRPLRQLRPVSTGALPSAGPRNGVCDRPLHVPSGAAHAVRG
jgi:hypothetical protein